MRSHLTVSAVEAINFANDPSTTLRTYHFQDADASRGTHKLASVSTAIAPADSMSAASCSVHTPPAPMMGIPIIAAEWTISSERGNND